MRRRKTKRKVEVDVTIIEAGKSDSPNSIGNAEDDDNIHHDKTPCKHYMNDVYKTCSTTIYHYNLLIIL
jgi:hypothetical protein